MASDPGSVFSSHAFAALHRSRALFAEDRWVLGIEASSAQALQASLEQALKATARSASTSPESLRSRLPTEEIQNTLAELSQQQQLALTTARTYASSFTSFLARSLHVEEESAGAYLRALAARHSDDACIADPLSTFAEGLARWQILVDRCAQEIASDRSLFASYRLRLLARAGLAVGSGFLISLVIAASLHWWIVTKNSRERVQRTLDQPDPCAAEGLREADQQRATPQQLDLRNQRLQACAAQRAQQKYVGACTALAEHVESNQLKAEDDQHARDCAPLLRRTASASLTLDDLLVGENAMPCQDTPAGPRLWSAFARTVAKSDSLWAQAEKVSPKLLSLLSQPPFALSDENKNLLASRAEAIARRAVVSGLPAEMTQARNLCALQNKLLAGPLGRGCKALARIDAKH